MVAESFSPGMSDHCRPISFTISLAASPTDRIVSAENLPRPTPKPPPRARLR
jgi:hypothetical protein